MTLIEKMYASWDAEVVFITSNYEGTPHDHSNDTTHKCAENTGEEAECCIAAKPGQGDLTHNSETEPSTSKLSETTLHYPGVAVLLLPH